MAATVYTAAITGLDGVTVAVEAHVGRALPGVTIVGLPDISVQEARERVRAAIVNSGVDFPKTKVTVNLAPGDVRKEGPLYDLPVALAILIAGKMMVAKIDIKKYLFIGELALDGSLRGVHGVLSAAMHAASAGFTHIVLPAANAAEAALVGNVTVLSANHLRDVITHCMAERSLSIESHREPEPGVKAQGFDFGSIRGQTHAKRALEIAAAGGHNVRLTGPPGSGKTLLARSCTTILPTLTPSELLEVTRIYSVAGLLQGQSCVTERPFRNPHHTTSSVALVGGGSAPRPGEVTLAHRGVLFLDEFPEFPRHVLEAMRQPLEDGNIVVARAAGASTFPARFMLVAAENPCPCGYATDTVRDCTCSAVQLVNYQRRVSGPLLDRIDLHVPVPAVPVEELAEKVSAEPSSVVRERVQAARERQSARQKQTGVMTNAELASEQVQQWCSPKSAANKLLQSAVDRLHLSARSYYRLLKLARTISDLAAADEIKEEHIAEALQYRIREPGT